MVAIATTAACLGYGIIQHRLGFLTPNPAWAGASQNSLTPPTPPDPSPRRQPQRLNLLGLILDQNAPPPSPPAIATVNAQPILPDLSQATSPQPTHQVLGEALASWYGPGFHGQLTANGELYDQNALTAAHRDLPFDTRLRVTNLTSGKSVVVRVNDRGPYVDGRDIDLSAGAAEAIGSSHSGVVPVRLEILK